jgi:hypothetical protein
MLHPPKSNFHKSIDHPNIVPLFSNIHRGQLSILVPRFSLSLYDVLRNSKLQRRMPLEASLVLFFLILRFLYLRFSFLLSGTKIPIAAAGSCGFFSSVNIIFLRFGRYNVIKLLFSTVKTSFTGI